jgi:branched-chain amino acid transport system substrate-binding protein
VAILACVEAQACTQYYDQMPNYTSRNGMTVVYKTNISVTQVDFTNECLQARSRGADLVVPVGDQNTFHRVFSDCGRQGYHPAFIASAGNDTDANVQGLDNVAAASGGFPFDGPPGSAAVQDYLTAFHTYAPSEPFGIYTSLGWASAKLFQHVAETVLGAGGPLTSGRLLSALWSLKGYSVDGLSLPLTYTQGKASQGTPFCWFPMLFTGGHWTAPSGMQTVCDNP